jgi:hypothetical protein
MTERPFSLIPFPGSNVPDLTIDGKILRQNSLLTIQYTLTGSLEEIYLPSPVVNPRRKPELWKTTCLEFFLAARDSPDYWEFNLSPSGDWNVYRMEAYRRIGFREEPSIQQLQIETDKAPNSFRLNTVVDMNPLIRVGQSLEVGVAAVILSRAEGETYWALVHPAPEADFHLRGGFILAMAE